MLEIQNIRKSFGNLEVLRGVDIRVERGDVAAILGPSGSGKTTLLRCMNFLEKAHDFRLGNICDEPHFQKRSGRASP